MPKLDPLFEELFKIISESEENKKWDTTMTKKDFTEMASMISSLKGVMPDEHRNVFAMLLVKFFKDKNPRFNSSVFLKACDLVVK